MERSGMIKPDGYGDEHKEYLDELRESGATNMFGAAAYLREEFGLDKGQAKDYLFYWMGEFGND